MVEIWKDIQGYEGLYQVSNLGNVKSVHYGSKANHPKWESQSSQILKQKISTSGYYRVELYSTNSRKCFYVHRLVALTFIPNPQNKKEVNHIDGKKLNNQINNLEWVSRSENQIHALKTGLRTPPMRGRKSHKSPSSKPIIQYSLDGVFVKLWYAVADAARYFNVNPSCISNCALGRHKTSCGFKWKFMEDDFIPMNIDMK